MAGPSITGSVGENAKNNLADVKTVQTLLNGFVVSGQLGSSSPLVINGDPVATIPLIRKFQSNVAGFGNPDGKISVDGNTWKKLIAAPRSATAAAEIDMMVRNALARPPVDTIKSDLWIAGLTALSVHGGNPKLMKPQFVTFMDFRIKRDEERLWLVNVKDHKLIQRTWVAHGTNSGGSFATSFGDGLKKTSLGPYITLSMYHTDNVGHVKQKEPALKIIGLEKGLNGRALERGILFHAATYVKPRDVGNSWGCFATPVEDNRMLVPTISGGSFAFALGNG